MTSRTVTVSTAAQLAAAARTAKGGDTILLAPGNYGDVRLDNLNPKGTITVKSANPDNDAVLRTLTMMNAHNVVIQDIDISRPMTASENRNNYAVNVGRSSNLTFVGIDVSGSMNNDARDDGHGMSLTGSRLSILDSTFTQLGFAVVVAATDYVFAGNTMTQVREGMQMRATKGALVANNIARDFQANYAAGEHPDVFQVHTGGTAGASSNLIFRNNLMATGAEGGVGGIFIRSETPVPRRHSNILIENNIYEGNFTHGISVSNADNVTLRGNTIRAGVNEGLVSSILLADINGGLVEKNVTQRILDVKSLPNTGVVMRDNIDIWDVNQKKGIAVADLFAQPTSSASKRVDAMNARPESLAAGDFADLNVLATSAAGRIGAGFKSVAHIGNLAGTAEQQMAAWLPALDTNLAVFG